MLQHECLVKFWVQKSLTKPHINSCCNEWEQVQDNWIGMSKISCWVPSLLFHPEPNELKFVAWCQLHQCHPIQDVRQPRLLRMTKWYTLNQWSDGNHFVCWISNDTAAKKFCRQCRGAGSHAIVQIGRCQAQLWSLLRWIKIVFLKF